MGDRALTFSMKNNNDNDDDNNKHITLYKTHNKYNIYLILTHTLNWYLSWILLAKPSILQAGEDSKELAW